MKAITGLLHGDTVNVIRDPMLGVSLLAPLILGMILRVVVPQLAEAFRGGIQLAEWYSFITGVAVLIPGLLVGYTTGFLFLEERDEKILAAIAVTKTGTPGFLVYRLGISFFIGLLASLGLILLSGLSDPGIQGVVTTGVFVGLQSVLFVLFLATFAEDRVKGLALTKVMGFGLFAPAAILIIPAPWYWLAGVVPTFWTTKVFLSSEGGNQFEWFCSVAVGLAVHTLWFILLFKAFRRKITRT